MTARAKLGDETRRRLASAAAAYTGNQRAEPTKVEPAPPPPELEELEDIQLVEEPAPPPKKEEPARKKAPSNDEPEDLR